LTEGWVSVGEHQLDLRAAPRRVAPLARVDRVILAILAPLWLVCAALFVYQMTCGGGVVWPAALVSNPRDRRDYPVVVGFWPAMGAEGRVCARVTDSCGWALLRWGVLGRSASLPAPSRNAGTDVR
jgi:hypothetical protein